MDIRPGVDALSSSHFDVCVVGAGPVGLALASALAKSGLRTLVLDSGPRRPALAGSPLSDARILSPNAHAEMSMAVRRGFGGTSWLWGGRCLPLDADDLDGSGATPGRAWPIREPDVAPFYAAASDFLGCGTGGFTDAAPPDAARLSQQGVRIDQLERWSNEPQLARRIVGDPHKGLTVCLNSTVVEIETAGIGRRLSGLKIATATGIATFDRARAFVLAAGGLETTRILLSAQADRSDLFGGPAGPLGRYYMGHVSGVIADIVFFGAQTADLFDYRLEKLSATRRRLTFNREVRLDEGLPNICFLPFNPRLSDAGHGMGTLSALFLLLSLPGLGRRFISEAILRSQLEGRSDYPRHVRNLILDSPSTIRDLTKILAQRVLEGRRKPFFFYKSRKGEYPLHYHAEHLPSAISRVTLDDERDVLGMRRLLIDIKYGEDDARGVVLAHAALDRRLRAAGVGCLRFRQPPADRVSAVLDQARDGLHQIGATRMGFYNRDGVVDANCKVFGFDNLFVAGSGVFRTSGQANPTFFATALALRLAAYLRSVLER
ncbi:MAG: GMC oxidoreductase [Caulobacter sp.]|nr:GMC oxidoreductase [Caulobacter sp.]